MKQFNPSIVMGAVALLATGATADWTAYNDFSWATGQPSSAITTNSPLGVTNGYLIDHASGQTLSAQLQIAGPTAAFGAPLGASPIRVGTDAALEFGSAVNGDGFLYMGSTGTLFFTIRNLNPTARYDIVIYSSRQATSDTYNNRWSEIQLSDCGAGFTNASSAGVPQLQTGGLPNDTARILAGNTNGLVAKFIGIDPGNDQDIDINIKGYATAGYSTNAYVNAFKLVAHGEPSTNFEAYTCAMTNGQLRPTWRVQPGRRYTLKYKNKLTDPVWSTYTTNLAPTATAYAVSLPIDQASRYFQMIEEPQQAQGGSGGSDSNRYFMIWPQYMSDVTSDGVGPLVTTSTVDSFTRTIRSAKSAGCNAVVINNLSWETAMQTRNGAKDWRELEYYLWRVNQEGMKAVLTFGWWRQCKHKPQTLPNSLFVTGHGSRDAEWRAISTNCTEFWTDHQVMHNGTNTLEPGMNMCVGSFSSPATVLSMSNYISAMSDYIWNQSPYGSNVIAIMPSYGNNGEARDFIGWDNPNPNGNLWATDYSQAAINGFRAWLQTKYGAISALNTAWGTSHGSFSSVSAPLPNTWSWGLSYNNDGQGRDWVAYGAHVLRNLYTSLRNGMRAVAPQSRFALGAKDLKGTYMFGGHVGNIEYVMQPADYIISYAGIANQIENSLGHEDNREFLLDVIKGTHPTVGAGQALDHRDLSGDSSLLQRTSTMTFKRGGQFFMLWLRWSDAAWVENNKTLIQNAVNAANLNQPVATRNPVGATSFTFQQQFQDADISATWRTLSSNGDNIVNVQQQNNGAN